MVFSHFVHLILLSILSCISCSNVPHSFLVLHLYRLIRPGLNHMLHLQRIQLLVQELQLEAYYQLTTPLSFRWRFASANCQVRLPTADEWDQIVNLLPPCIRLRGNFLQIPLLALIEVLSIVTNWAQRELCHIVRSESHRDIKPFLLLFGLFVALILI